MLHAKEQHDEEQHTDIFAHFGQSSHKQPGAIHDIPANQSCCCQQQGHRSTVEQSYEEMVEIH